MQIPSVQGIIDRRLLINYRVQPEVVQQILPSPFRPKLHGGFAIAGICLIRLKQIRPRWLPMPIGMGSENAAHRIAVEWREGHTLRQGVFIPRRDTNSRFNTLVGGWLFPGEHHHATFKAVEAAGSYTISIRSDDNQMHLQVSGEAVDRWPTDSVFSSLAEASKFFEHGSLGYSTTSKPGRFDALEMRCNSWQVTPFKIDGVQSSFFNNTSLFPAQSAQLDCALLMRGIQHQWHAKPNLCCDNFQIHAPTSACQNQSLETPRNLVAT